MLQLNPALSGRAMFSGILLHHGDSKDLYLHSYMFEIVSNGILFQHTLGIFYSVQSEN